MPPPLVKPSNEPAFPKPTGPSSASRRCPISPPISEAPRMRRPSAITPPPMPVPIVRKIVFSAPRPAPSFHSTSAQALASFCKNARTPKRFSSLSTSGTFTQPGRFGGASTSPRRLSKGPPQLTPMASTSALFMPLRSKTSSTASKIRPSMSSQPRSARDAKRSLSKI